MLKSTLDFLFGGIVFFGCFPMLGRIENLPPDCDLPPRLT